MHGITRKSYRCNKVKPDMVDICHLWVKPNNHSG